MSVGLKDRLTRFWGGVVAPLRHRKADPQPKATLQRPYPWERSYPEGVTWDHPMAAKTLPEIFDEAVAAYGKRTCISFRGRAFTYDDIDKQVARAASGFRALGVSKGIKVGLLLPNCPYTVICYYAVLKAGGTVVNINPLYAEREIARQVADAGIRILVTLDLDSLYSKVSALVADPAKLERLVICSMAGILLFREKAYFTVFKRSEIADIPKDEWHLNFDKLIDNEDPTPDVDIDPLRDVAVLQYTGGTTGLPKGACLTHANLAVNARQLQLWRPNGNGEEPDKILGVLPIFHAFGMTSVMNLGILMGAEMVLLPHFNVAEVLSTIDRARPNIFVGVPTMFSALVAAKDLARFDLSSLDYCISGGAPLRESLCRRFEELTGCTLVEGYGLSETPPVCTVNPLQGGNRPGSVGLPLPGTLVEIYRLDRPDLAAGPGEKGEVCISGPQVMRGYANRAKETADAFQGGRFHSGDVGYLDADGYLFIVDRIKDIVISGGFNVYPRMVEEAIHLHPAVAEAAVCGVPDPHRGEVVKAFVQLKEGESLTGGQLRAFLKDKLAAFEQPRSVEFRKALPLTLIGKVSKKDLLAEVAAEAEKRGKATAADS
ncbi:MAG TPA: long-chain fatty acid--CoA ligase [Kiloniellaceae bacterium]|nr:long-chain fatty acid--CoA ligase [Kiloniellaceae bacterium]